MPQQEVTGLSRRQMLRRGVAVGTAVWTVPTVTAITLTPANAASPSGEPPTEPPKPPHTEPPEPPPTEPPSNETTPPPSGETTPPPNPSNPSTPPGGTSTPSSTPTSSTPQRPGDDDDTTAGGLPNTGPGDVGRGLAAGGLLTAAGAAMYVASRKQSPAPGDAQPGATA